MSEEQGTKVKTSISLSPYLFEWMTGLVKDRTFVSNSDAITTALSEMKGRMEDRIERERESKYEEWQKELERLRKDCDHQTKILLTLLNTHQELVDEVNDIEMHPVNSKTLKVD